MGFRKGTGFTNLNKVISANRGNRLGSAVAGGISTQNQGVNTGIQKAQSQFGEEAQKNRLDTEEAKNQREQILGKFTQPVANSGTSSIPNSSQTSPFAVPPITPGAPAGSSTTNASQPAPAGATSQTQPVASTAAVPSALPAEYPSPVSDQEIKDFTKFRTGTYAGPTELKDYGSLLGKAQQAEQLGNLSRSTGGRQELLRRFVGQGNNYNQGEKRLDETLLGQDANGVRNAARSTAGATGKVEAANQQAGNLANEYVGRAKIFGEETGKRIGEVKAPISSQLDTEVTGAQGTEDRRLAVLKEMQDLLAGTNVDKKVDPWTRAGLALQEAADNKYLNQGDINMLMGQNGKTGLLQRGANLGLDVNKLLVERIKNATAQNVDRTGLANSEEIAKLNALDRLAGKIGPDLEFLNGQNKYAAGNTGFDIGSLEDYIKKSEGEKAASDKAYADKLAAQQGSYLNQALAYGLGGIGAGSQALGNIVGTTSGNAGLVGAGVGNYLENQAATNAASRAAGYEGAGLGASEAASLAPGVGTSAEYGATALPGAEAADLAIMRGNHAALGTEAGAAEAGATGAEAAGAELGAGPMGLAAMLGADVLTGKDTTAQTANAIGNAGLGAVGAGAQGNNALLEGLLKLQLGDKSIANTPVGQQLMNVIAAKSKLENQGIGEAGKILGSATGGVGGLTSTGLNDIIHGNLGNLLNNAYSASGATSALKGGTNVANAVGNAVSHITGGGIKISDEDLKTNINYNPKDVQGFMDRLKPASYDYKKEVQNDPRASKDRQIGVMAQDLEKSKLGKEAVHNEDVGKVVDYKDLEPKMLASLAALNQRLKKLEGKE